MNAAVHEYVDPSPILYEIQARLTSAKLQPLKPYFNLTRPFSVKLWFLLAGTLITVMMIVMAMEHLTSSSSTTVIIQMFGVLLNQSKAITRKNAV